MKPINFLFTVFIWTFLLFFGFSNLNAQETQKENSVCGELKKAGIFIGKDEFLVAGEVSDPYVIRFVKLPLTLAQIIAMVGGVKRSASNEIVQVFNCSSNSETDEGIIVKNHLNIKKGIESDLELKGGEIILVLNKDSKKTLSVLEAFRPRCRGLCISK